MNNIETINGKIENQFLAGFLILSRAVGREKQTELKLLSRPKRERFSFIAENGEGDGRKIIRGKFEPYFNVNKHSDEIIARVYQEERKGVLKLEERITHAENYSKNRIEKDKWTYNKHSESEKKATIEVFNLMENGSNLIIWISPKSDIYEEGRLNVILPGIKNGEEIFDPWGIPITLSWKESIELGNKLLDKGGILSDEAYNLREQPIGFRLKPGENWIEKCKELIPGMRWAWDFIKSGKVDQNMKKLALKIKRAKEIAKGDNVLFEKTMLDMGYMLNASGNHGGSWLTKELGIGMGIIVTKDDGGKLSYRIGSTEGLTQCSICGCWYNGEKCPVCNKLI